MSLDHFLIQINFFHCDYIILWKCHWSIYHQSSIPCLCLYMHFTWDTSYIYCRREYFLRCVLLCVFDHSNFDFIYLIKNYSCGRSYIFSILTCFGEISLCRWDPFCYSAIVLKIIYVKSLQFALHIPFDSEGMEYCIFLYLHYKKKAFFKKTKFNYLNLYINYDLLYTK